MCSVCPCVASRRTSDYKAICPIRLHVGFGLIRFSHPLIYYIIIIILQSRVVLYKSHDGGDMFTPNTAINVYT